MTNSFQFISPRNLSRWRKSSAQWVTARAQMRATIYPSGLPTTGVDVIESDYGVITKPTGVRRIDRYTINNPGGRIGSNQYQYLLTPTLAPAGKLLVWACGHVDAWEQSEYFWTNGESMCLRLLALGWHVLVIEMPGKGRQPGGVNHAIGEANQQITVASVLTNITVHDYNTLDADGGPPSTRMFLDQMVRATNQAVSSSGAGTVVLAGHSGGGISAAMHAAIDDRFGGVYLFEGGNPATMTGAFAVSPNTVEWEQSASNILYTSAPYAFDYYGLTLLAGAVPRRHSSVLGAIEDEYFTIPISKQPYWLELQEARTEFLNIIGATASHYLEGGGAGHDMTKARVDWALADMGANGFI